MNRITLPVNVSYFSTRIEIGLQTFTWDFRYNPVASRWGMKVTNEDDITLFEKVFLAVGVNYADIFVGFPENVAVWFEGDETSDDMSLIKMYVEDEDAE